MPLPPRLPRYGANAGEAADVRRRGRRRRRRVERRRRRERGRAVGRRVAGGGEEAAAERGPGPDVGEELRAREQAGAGAEAAAGARAGAAAAAGGHLVPEPARAVEDEAAGERLRRAQAPARRCQGRQRRTPLPQQEAPGRDTGAEGQGGRVGADQPQQGDRGVLQQPQREQLRDQPRHLAHAAVRRPHGRSAAASSSAFLQRRWRHDPVLSFRRPPRRRRHRPAPSQLVGTQAGAARQWRRRPGSCGNRKLRQPPVWRRRRAAAVLAVGRPPALPLIDDEMFAMVCDRRKTR